MTPAAAYDYRGASNSRLAAARAKAAQLRDQCDTELLSGRLRGPLAATSMMWRLYDVLADLLRELDHRDRLDDIDAGTAR